MGSALPARVAGAQRAKSVEPMAAHVAPDEVQQLHHFVATSAWDWAPLERVLLDKADGLVGGAEAFLIVDDTGIPKKGSHSVGVCHPYCGQLGKEANCQVLVSLTLAKADVPVPVALRLYLPKAWADDPVRRAKARVPEEIRFQPKWQIALDEIVRARAAGVRFGAVLADAGYGCCSELRKRLSEMGVVWAVGIPGEQLVYPRSVRLRFPPHHAVLTLIASAFLEHLRRLSESRPSRFNIQAGLASSSTTTAHSAAGCTHPLPSVWGSSAHLGANMKLAE